MFLSRLSGGADDGCPQNSFLELRGKGLPKKRGRNVILLQDHEEERKDGICRDTRYHVRCGLALAF